MVTTPMDKSSDIALQPEINFIPVTYNEKISAGKLKICLKISRCIEKEIKITLYANNKGSLPPENILVGNEFPFVIKPNTQEMGVDVMFKQNANVFGLQTIYFGFRIDSNNAVPGSYSEATCIVTGLEAPKTKKGSMKNMLTDFSQMLLESNNTSSAISNSDATEADGVSSMKYMGVRTLLDLEKKYKLDTKKLEMLKKDPDHDNNENNGPSNPEINNSSGRKDTSEKSDQSGGRSNNEKDKHDMASHLSCIESFDKKGHSPAPKLSEARARETQSSPSVTSISNNGSNTNYNGKRRGTKFSSVSSGDLPNKSKRKTTMLRFEIQSFLQLAFLSIIRKL
jgi:hypothetical protein